MLKGGATAYGREGLTMKYFNIIPTTAHAGTQGDLREWSLCEHFHISRTKHDSLAYDKGSDLDVGDMHISVKASGFSLMSGRLCEGREDFDGIWELYAERTHSNTFAYITTDFTCYLMNLDEFKAFIYAFCRLERESSKNGGQIKIKARAESKKMLGWLAEKANA